MNICLFGELLLSICYCVNQIFARSDQNFFDSLSSPFSLLSPQFIPHPPQHQRGCRPHVELGGGLQGAGGPRTSLVLAGAGPKGEGGENCEGGGKVGDRKVTQ